LRRDRVRSEAPCTRQGHGRADLPQPVASNSVARGLAPRGGVPAGCGAAGSTQWHGLDSTGPTPGG
jgi:hypothetical protein